MLVTSSIIPYLKILRDLPTTLGPLVPPPTKSGAAPSYATGCQDESFGIDALMTCTASQTKIACTMHAKVSVTLRVLMEHGVWHWMVEEWKNAKLLTLPEKLCDFKIKQLDSRRAVNSRTEVMSTRGHSLFQTLCIFNILWNRQNQPITFFSWNFRLV